MLISLGGVAARQVQGAVVSAEVSSPGPVFTRVRLVGSPEEVGRLTALLGGAAEVVFDSPS